MSKFILFLLVVFMPQIVSAYTISGKVINQSQEPMAGASVVLYKDSTTIAASTLADTNGLFRFSSDINGNLRIRVTMIGTVPVDIRLEGTGHNLDLGVVTLAESPTLLGEVVVETQNVVEKGCNYIVLPTANEIKLSNTSLDLLEMIQYKLPGLQVNSTLQRVTIENGTAVFQINGRQVDFSRILSLNNDNILRIEYSNVSDIRYGTSVMGVINYITKPVAKGGSLLANAMISDGMINSNIGTTLNYGKSEFTLDYDYAYRDFDEVYSTGTEYFIGRNSPLIRKNMPIPSFWDNQMHKLLLGYTYMLNPTTMFAITLSGSMRDNNETINNLKHMIYDAETTEFLSTSVNHNKLKTPKLDIYFRNQLNKTSRIEFNAYGTMSSGDYANSLKYKTSESDYTQHANTDNETWRVGAEALYTKQYSKFETKYGINYYHNYAQNLYVENDGEPQLSKQDNDNMYLHGAISGRIKNATYSAGIGGRYYMTRNGYDTQRTFKLNSKVSVNYKLNKNWSLNYLFMLDPSMPSLASQADVTQRIDDISYRKGNPDLKPSTYLRNRIYVRYATPKFNFSLWAAHSRNNNSIYSDYTYCSDKSSPYYDKFITQSRNAKHDDLINIEANLGFTLAKKLMVYGICGWDRYTFSGFGDIKPFENLYANFNVTYAYKNLRLSGRFEIKPRYNLSGNFMKTPERCNVIMAQYLWKDFRFTVGVFNPFSHRGVLYKTKELSSVHPSNNNYYIKDGANMVMVGVTYRINIGHKYKKAKKELINDGIDSGIETDNKDF